MDPVLINCQKIILIKVSLFAYPIAAGYCKIFKSTMSNNEIEIIDLDSSIESLEPQDIEMINLVSEDEQEVELLQPVAGPSGVGK